MLGRIVEALARLMAVLGGLVLTGLILMTCLSILGRSASGVLNADWMPEGLGAALLGLGIGPIRGDFELVEAGMAFVIFAFLPITQLKGGHASVDIFTNMLGLRANRVLTLLWALLFAAAMVLIAWQLWQGTQDKMRNGETSFLIQFPIWWAYAASLVGAVAAAATSVYIALVRLAELATGDAILTGEGAEH
ncbi:TRAP transporter small permease [Jannaschia seohaensis]|uniref:TRAP transporter small permease protein n=1 Tax=Jannaschia seohaensis TaxID=475081 RepID=A0A2Y9C3W3_9RHOB|nr:TRAP transporter small permease [Jannaschia seohaensis]PWJ22245.1 tripartite ATP-independent transporter DctQ subunit [Jannaschia seohaensis]SSA38523.1 Tripartite ATP-independent transporter, DctQ component [Jannaschia seohaensis]